MRIFNYTRLFDEYFSNAYTIDGDIENVPVTGLEIRVSDQKLPKIITGEENRLYYVNLSIDLMHLQGLAPQRRS